MVHTSEKSQWNQAPTEAPEASGGEVTCTDPLLPVFVLPNPGSLPYHLLSVEPTG